MKACWWLGWATVCCLVGAGCGYHVGTIGHPDLHTVRIAPVVNQSREPQLEVVAQQKLRAQFMQDGTLKVVEDAGADCVLVTRVVSCTEQPRGAVRAESDKEQQRRYTTVIFALELVVEYELQVPGREGPVLKPRRVVGKADFNKLADHETDRKAAFQLAVTDAARQIVTNVTEAW